MKKILVLFIALLVFNSANAAENLSFIYINGSNNNDVKMKNWYENGVVKLHAVLRKKFLKNRDMKNYFADKGGINIKEEPVIFFWGYNSHDDLNFVKNQLKISKAVSSKGAYIVRNLISQYLHDAIWVQKPHNMLPILDDLNAAVISEANTGNDVILFGYSAGTFVTYEYLFNKLRYIEMEKLFTELKADDDFMKFVKNHPQNNTCLSAISSEDAGIGTYTPAGHIVLNPDKKKLKEKYLNLNKITESACAPVGKVKGVVNFASPIPLFYSDLSDENYEPNYYNKLMAKYILENGIYLLTVNFKEDPLGFPSNRNLTIEEYEKRINMNIQNPTGIIYDNSGVWSKRIFPLAHTSYWSARGTFSNAIVKSFINGYKFEYDKDYQQKVIRRNSKKSEL